MLIAIAGVLAYYFWTFSSKFEYDKIMKAYVKLESAGDTKHTIIGYCVTVGYSIAITVL
jgi:hypothetical protein